METVNDLLGTADKLADMTSVLLEEKEILLKGFQLIKAALDIEGTTKATISSLISSTMDELLTISMRTKEEGKS